MSTELTLPFSDPAFRLDEASTLTSGRLCLEFANTADWHASPAPEETLHSYIDLVGWSERVGILDSTGAEELRALAQVQPALVDQVITWAIDLREAMYRLFAALANGASFKDADIAMLNEAIAYAYTGGTLSPGVPNFGWHFRGDRSGLDRMLWPILRSAVRLLTESDLTRLGQCADDRGCGYLFYDTSRNRKRRWCDMNSCGNRAKAQRHYNRQRKRRPTAQAELQPEGG
jgi:predicted RNA-binding Zn ribbon-like protein